MTDDIDLKHCYEEGFAKHGDGAVVIDNSLEWHFISIKQLWRFRFTPIEKSCPGEFQYNSNNLINLVVEVAETTPDQFVVARKFPRFWFGSFYWPFSWRLSIVIEPRFDSAKVSPELLIRTNDTSEAISPQGAKHHRIALIQKLDQAIAWLDAKAIEAHYREGFTEHGPGVIVTRAPGKYRFVPLAQVRRLEQVNIVGTWANSDRSLSEVAQQCPSDYFVLIRECYIPFWPLGQQLLVFVRHLDNSDREFQKLKNLREKLP